MKTTSSLSEAAGPVESREAQSSVYDALASHQRTEAWSGQQLICTLQDWAKLMIVEFKLDIPELALCIDVLPVSRLGHFRPGHNGFGLKCEVAINSCYTSTRTPCEILRTLLHELLHAWQHIHGTPSKNSHHNAEFKEKALTFGLIVDSKGVTGHTASNLFKDLLRKHGIEVPEGEMKPTPRLAGKSKSRKWVCGCDHIRSGRSKLNIRCLDCGQVFQMSGGPASAA